MKAIGYTDLRIDFGFRVRAVPPSSRMVQLGC